RAARRPDDGLHVAQVLVERHPACARQRVLAARHPAFERLRALQVARVLQLPRVDAQVAVGRAEERLQVVERQLLVDGERAHDAQPQAFVNELVEIQGRGRVIVGVTRTDARTPPSEPADGQLVVASDAFGHAGYLRLVRSVRSLHGTLSRPLVQWRVMADNPKGYVNPHLLESPAGLAGRLAGDAPPLVIDLRPPDAFAAGHIPGAVHLDLFGVS